MIYKDLRQVVVKIGLEVLKMWYNSVENKIKEEKNEGENKER